MPASGPRPNRGPSAAAENRAAIIAAARERFADEGLAAPLNAIARDAGVGQGSLYRHFADRLALAVAVFDENLDALEAHVADAAVGVDALLHLVEQQAVVSPGLVDLMWQHLGDERVAHLGARIADVAQAAVAHDHAAGALPVDVDASDVLAAVSLLADLTARTAQLPTEGGGTSAATEPAASAEPTASVALAHQAARARALVRRGLGLQS